MSMFTSDEPEATSILSSPSPRLRPPSPRILRGLAAVVALALVVVLLVAVLANAAGSRGGTAGVVGRPTGAAKPTQPVSNWPPVKPTFSPTLPWGTPTPTLPPISSAITPEQAWGANAAERTLNTRLDATTSMPLRFPLTARACLVRMASSSGQNHLGLLGFSTSRRANLPPLAFPKRRATRSVAATLMAAICWPHTIPRRARPVALVTRRITCTTSTPRRSASS